MYKISDEKKTQYMKKHSHLFLYLYESMKNIFPKLWENISNYLYVFVIPRVVYHVPPTHPIFDKSIF